MTKAPKTEKSNDITVGNVDSKPSRKTTFHEKKLLIGLFITTAILVGITLLLLVKNNEVPNADSEQTDESVNIVDIQDTGSPDPSIQEDKEQVSDVDKNNL